MATVNLFDIGWSGGWSNNIVTFRANYEFAEFGIPDDCNGYIESAKIYVPIYDIGEYTSITLKYYSFSATGIYDCKFGIFDNTSVTSSSGIISDHKFSSSGGTITIGEDVLSNLSGTIYVGFYFYGNSYSPGVNEYGYPHVKIMFDSFTATERTYTLTYDANGGSGAPKAVSNIRSTTISDVVPTRSSHDFLGWSETKTATYATYFAGNTISLTSNKTLYAVWRKFYTVTYDANGGSSAPSPEKKIEGSTLILSGFSITPPANTSVTCTITFNANGGTCDKNTETITHVVSYTFINWNTSSDGSGTSYEAGDAYSNDSDITLYAQYASTTTYNSTILPMPTRVGYEFLGWAESKDDVSGIIGEYTPDGDIVLYAIWKLMGNVYIYDGTGGFNPYLVFIYDDSGWSQYIPYIYTESGWEIYSG